MASGFLLEQRIRLSGLLQLDGRREGRHASRVIVGWCSPYGERVRGDGTPGGTCDCPGFGAVSGDQVVPRWRSRWGGADELKPTTTPLKPKEGATDKGRTRLWARALGR